VRMSAQNGRPVEKEKASADALSQLRNSFVRVPEFTAQASGSGFVCKMIHQKRGFGMWQTSKKRILLVEDNQKVQDVISWVLYFFGFEVALAGNGVEALAVFNQNSFDLVLTDLQMPIMDGSILASHIKQRSPQTPVILMTGADRETAWEKAERAPVDSVIFKPFKVKDLQDTVQRVLELREAEQGSVGMG
jgi:CheY-like chemotaxis protein